MMVQLAGGEGEPSRPDAPDEDPDTLRGRVESYYTRKVTQFGPTPPGVDWTCAPTQRLRFVQLLKLCDFGGQFSLNDLGCGYGALRGHLDDRHRDCAIDYLGIDLSDAMIRHARRRWRGRSDARFATGHASPRCADYSVASGVFNVQLHPSREAWESLVARTLDDLHRTSIRGFAVNLMQEPLSGRPGPVRLYATTPGPWAAYCADRFGALVEVVGGYGMREFTLLVRRGNRLPAIARDLSCVVQQPLVDACAGDRD